MPIRNIGTLLENIVLLEAFRALSAREQGAVELANCFAMPPLAEWREHSLDASFGLKELAALYRGARPMRGTYAELMWACLQQPPGAAGSQGPSGALLCALLAAQQGTPLRMWLNDVSEGHYGDALPALAAIDQTVRRVLDLPRPPGNVVVTCSAPYPSSLGPPATDDLEEVLAAWPRGGVGRVGFLDPMRYRLSDRKGPETSSADHRRWLRLLAEGCPGPVASVHFTGNRDFATLRPEVTQMRADGGACGYDAAVTASHAYYYLVTLIRDPAGEGEALALAEAVARGVEAQWKVWAHAIGRREANALTVVVERCVK